MKSFIELALVKFFLWCIFAPLGFAIYGLDWLFCRGPESVESRRLFVVGFHDLRKFKNFTEKR